MPGPSLLLPTLWAVNYGKDSISVADGVLTVHAAKGNWFTYENPATAIRVKDSFVVDLKMDGAGHYGVIFYGRSASGSEWWQGLRRFDVGFDGDKYPVIEYRDGTSSAGQRWALKRLDLEGMTIVFSPQGAAFDVLDATGNTLLRAPVPVTLSQPVFPDNLMWLGTNADGGVKGGSSLTVSRVEVRSAKGETAWKKTPATGDLAAKAPSGDQTEPKTGIKNIPLTSSNPNEVALYPDQTWVGGQLDNQGMYVQFVVGDPPGAQGGHEIVSDFVIGPHIQTAWIDNGQVFISFSYTHDDRVDQVVGRFIADPYTQRVIVENPFSSLRIQGRKPEQIPAGAKLALWLAPGSIEAIRRSPNEIVGIVGLGY